MPFLTKNEEKINNNELIVKKLLLEAESLTNETSKIFNELKISEEEFLKYLENKENFTESEWEALQNEKQNVEKQLDSLNIHQDPSKTNQARNDLHMSRNWIFIR